MNDPLFKSGVSQFKAIERACREIGVDHSDYDSYEVSYDYDRRTLCVVSGEKQSGDYNF